MGAHDLTRMLGGFSLTTAEILYRMPDHPSLLQTYVWQDYDLTPRYPKLHEFLAFWEASLDGKLFKVTVNHRTLVSPAEMRTVGAQFSLN
ncbi:MAG: protein usg [Hyphomicrobiaceae bacterium]|nr:protein usg [Hyphomicrobiaceae bacterium]